MRERRRPPGRQRFAWQLLGLVLASATVTISVIILVASWFV